MEVLFIYEEQQIKIQCNINDIMKDIINIFKNKIKEEYNNLYYIYKGDKINEDLKLYQLIKDKNVKNINIIVYNNKENGKDIALNEIICPECKEKILINIKDYKINLYGCKNGHKMKNILLNEYENIPKINISKTICNKCYKNNINKDNGLYICN